jgi:hypothetical protein
MVHSIGMELSQGAPFTTANQLNCKHIMCNSQLV